MNKWWVSEWVWVSESMTEWMNMNFWLPQRKLPFWGTSNGRRNLRLTFLESAENSLRHDGAFKPFWMRHFPVRRANGAGRGPSHTTGYPAILHGYFVFQVKFVRQALWQTMSLKQYSATRNPELSFKYGHCWNTFTSCNSILYCLKILQIILLVVRLWMVCWISISFHGPQSDY